MRDKDIRQALHKKRMVAFLTDPNTLVVNELGLCQGDARVDIAIINGSLHGYEIKSEQDTLERLPWQCDVYSRVLDTVTVVANQNHIPKILGLIPSWWGVLNVVELKKGIGFKTVRKSKRNPSVDPYCLAQLLWRNEVLTILEANDLAKGIRTKPRQALWRALADNFPLDQLSNIVRQTIKARENWRVDSLQKQDGDSLPL